MRILCAVKAVGFCQITQQMLQPSRACTLSPGLRQFVILLRPIHHLVVIPSPGTIEDLYSELAFIVSIAGLRMVRGSLQQSVPPEPRDTEIYNYANGADLV